MWAWLFGGLLLATTLVVALQAARRPVLLRMGLRNAARRPRQTAMVIAGLMIGTAIISSALVAGDSAGSAVRGRVYDTLGEIDETVHVVGFPFFPGDIEEGLLADPQVAAAFDAVAPNAIWSVAADSPRTDLYEPRVQVVGLDPDKDAAFGPFHLAGGGTTNGRGLAPGDAIITQGLADALEVAPGDDVHIVYTLPLDPMLPVVTPIEGTVTGAQPLPTLPGAPVPGAMTHEVDVPDNATRLTAVLAWDPAAAGAPVTGLQATWFAPDGTERAQAGGAGALPPLWLNATDVEPGTWTLEVQGSGAVETAYRGAAVALVPAYDPSAYGELGDGPGDAGPDEELMDLFGDELRREAVFTVTAVTDGGRGDQFGFKHGMFVELGHWQRLLEREGEVNVLKFSNPGDRAEGMRHTDLAVERLEARLDELRAQRDDPVVHALEVDPVKQEFVTLADDAGQMFTGFILFAGSLSIITGLLLIVNIFTMLAEERRSELGMARAVGMRRKDLVRAFVFEGSLYAVVAAGIGALLGLGLAYLMVSGLNALIAGQQDFPPIPFVVDASAVFTAFAAGAVLTFATIFFSSRRASRLNIVRAIRRIEEPERTAGRWGLYVGAPLLLVGLLASVGGWVFGQFSAQVFGPLVLALGLGLVLAREVRRSTLRPLLAGLLAAYYAVTFFVITEFDNMTEANYVGPIRGVLMTLAVVVVVSHWRAGPRALGSFLARVPRLRPIAPPAMSYPQHKRFRTGMTLAMFSLVILSIGFFSIFGALFDRDPATQTGGYDIEATTTLDVDGVEDLRDASQGLVADEELLALVHLEDHAAFDPGLITVNGERVGQYGGPGHHVYGYDAALVEAGTFDLLWRHEDHADDEAAYRAVLERDDAIIVSYGYSTDERGQDLANKVGDRLQIHRGASVREYTIIGIQEQYHFSGVFLPKEQVRALFPSPDDLFLAKIPAGADPEAFAKRLEQDARDVGLDAEASEVLVREEQETIRQILGAMKLFLGLGLVIGVLSLGIITSRSVLERRQEIGMMRAIGFGRNQIGQVFFLEVTLIVFLGGLVGLLSSIVVTYGLWFAVIRDMQFPYVIPWGEIAIILAVAYLVALAATVAPILRAARTPPAEAVRYIE